MLAAVGRYFAILLAAIIVLVIIMFVVFVCLGLVRAADYYRETRALHFPKVLASEVLPSLKTGDIILFVASTHDFTNSTLTQSLFSHGGMVVCEQTGELGEAASISSGNTKCLSESTLYSAAATGHEPLQSGANTTPLKERLQGYSGTVYCMRRRRPLNSAQCAAVQAAAARRDCPYPNSMQILYGLAGFRCYARHCFQHVGFLLDTAASTQVSDDGGAPFADCSMFAVVSHIVGLADGKEFGPIQWIQMDLDI